MSHQNANARFDVKLLIILIVVAAAMGVSLVAARQIRRGVLSKKALATGQAAYDEKDWQAASKSFRKYLRRNPNDIEILRKYAEALMSIRPLDASAIAGAIASYRLIVQLDPVDEAACERLATLYVSTGNFSELVSSARVRIEHDPDDRKAPLWLAQALIGLKRVPEARQTLATLLESLTPLPERHPEYVQACLMMSGLAKDEDAKAPKAVPEGEKPAEAQAVAGGEDANEPQTPLEWLDRAVTYMPDSVEALLSRAQLCRQMADAPDTSAEESQALREGARKDLETADAAQPKNPHILYAMGTEWLLHGRLDRAAAELRAIDELPKEVMSEHFWDPNDWTVARFLFVAELATRKGNSAEAAALAGAVLETARAPRHQLQVLPTAIDLYLAAGRIEDANGCVGKYEKVLSSPQGAKESRLQLAWFKARVALVRQKPYEVIEVLQPAVRAEGSNPQVWQLWDLLAEAYDQTHQASRALDARAKCLASLQRQSQKTPAMIQRANEIRRSLTTEQARRGDWEKLLEPLDQTVSVDVNDIALKLVRIGAVIGRVTEQGQRVDAAQLEALERELTALRQAHPDNVNVRVFQALLANYRGQPDQAERELKQAVEECAKPLAAEMQLVGLYRRTGRRAEAIGVCRKAAERNATVAQPWLTLSDLCVDGKDDNAARACLEEGVKSIKDEDGRDLLSIRLTRLDLERGHREEGITRLKAMAESDPQEIRARALLLALPEIQQDPETAQKLLGELRQIEGQSGLSWRLQQASLWSSSRDWRSKQKEIVALLQYCIEADPRSTPAVLVLADLYERLGDLRNAERVYREALAVDPSATTIADRLLSLLSRQGRYADAQKILPNITPELRPYVSERAGDILRAIADFRRKIEDDMGKTDAGSRVQLARLLYEQTKDADQSLRYLDEARAIDPNSRTQVATRARILVSERRVPEAVQVLDNYVADHNDFTAHWMRAVYLAEQGDLQRAEADYRKLTTFAQNKAAGYELLGNFYGGLGRFDEGIAAIDQGLNLYPEDLRLKRILMLLLLRRNQPQDRDKARQLLAVLEEQLPPDAELMKIRALQMLEESTPQSMASAKEKLQEAVRLEPRAVDAHLALISVMMRQREYKAACDCAIQALASNPGNPALLSARAGAELALGYAPMAVKLARQALQTDPNSVDAVGVFAQAALSSGDRSLLDEARVLTDSAVRRSQANERLLVSRAGVLAAVGSPKTAIPELEAYCQTKQGSSSVGALVTLANLYRLTGDADKSRQKIEQAERLDPSSQAVVHARFLWLVSQNRFTELAQISSAYRAAKDQDPAVVLSAASILSSLDPMEVKKEGARLFEYAVALAPTSMDARMRLARSLYQTGDIERAKKAYEKLLEQYPNDVGVLNDLAWILQERDHQYEAALELANRGLKLAPEDLFLLDTRATILVNLDRLAEAKRDFEELVRLAPADSPRQAKALLQLGRVCLRLNDLAQAKQRLSTALEIDGRVNVFTAAERSEINEILRKDGL